MGANIFKQVSVYILGLFGYITGAGFVEMLQPLWPFLLECHVYTVGQSNYYATYIAKICDLKKKD